MSDISEENLEKARDFCHACSPYDIISKVGAIYAFNKEVPGYLSSTYILRFLLENANPSSTKQTSPQRVRTFINWVNESKDLLVPGFISSNEQIQNALKCHSSPPMDLRMEIVAGLSSNIINPGTPGETLTYAVQKYAPFHLLMKERLGFDIMTACRTLTLLAKYSSDCIDEVCPETMRKMHSIPDLWAHPLLIPPDDLMKAWEKAMTLDSVKLGTSVYGYPLNWKVIDFLSADIAKVKSDPKIFSRWAIINKPSGEKQVILPMALRECLVSSVHYELTRSLTLSEAGGFSKRIGSIFEEIVRTEVQRRWQGVKASRPIKLTDAQGRQIGDLDSIITWNQHKIMVECKGGILRPQGRWGQTKYLNYDLDNTVKEAFKQLVRNKKSEPKWWEGAELTMIVLDQNIPLLTNYLERDSELKGLAEDLPYPIVLSYYDLRYILHRLDEEKFFDYVRWRKEYLSKMFVTPIDEQDIVYAYLFYKDKIKMDTGEQAICSFVPRDGQYEVETMMESLDILGFPRTLLRYD